MSICDKRRWSWQIFFRPFSKFLDPPPTSIPLIIILSAVFNNEARQFITQKRVWRLHLKGLRADELKPVHFSKLSSDDQLPSAVAIGRHCECSRWSAAEIHADLQIHYSTQKYTGWTQKSKPPTYWTIIKSLTKTRSLMRQVFLS